MIDVKIPEISVWEKPRWVETTGEREKLHRRTTWVKTICTSFILITFVSGVQLYKQSFNDAAWWPPIQVHRDQRHQGLSQRTVGTTVNIRNNCFFYGNRNWSYRWKPAVVHISPRHCRIGTHESRSQPWLSMNLWTKLYIARMSTPLGYRTAKYPVNLPDYKPQICNILTKNTGGKTGLSPSFHTVYFTTSMLRLHYRQRNSHHSI